MLGVVNEVPVLRDEPPVEAAYQLIVPELALAPKTTVPLPHLPFGLVVTVGTLFIVIIVVEDPAN
jgi:hypothetical protein